MKIFFKAYLASLLAGITFVFLLFLSIFLMPKEEKITVRKNSVLHIKLNKAITERSVDDPFENFDFVNYQSTASIGLNDLKAALRNAKSDDNIKGVFLEFGLFGGGLSTLKEFRDAILDFKESGKFVWSYADIFTQGGYYLASASDSVFINPSGFLEWNGWSSSRPYLKGLFDKIGIEPVVVRGSNNKFKSAVEPYLGKEMSEANKLQMETLLGDMWGVMLSEVSASRNMTTDSLQSITDGMKSFIPKKSLALGMVDGLLFKSDIDEKLKEITEAKSVARTPKISLKRYVKNLGNQSKEKNIAIIYAQGEIVMGDGGTADIGPTAYVKAIQKAAADDDVKAIVLRVNSPGGSALTSDIIHHELVKAQAKKPLVVSMGDYAASGGYFISAPANKIVAQPTTVTGSIGVFMMTFTAKDLLENKADVHYHTVKTGQMADLGNPARDMTEEEYKVLQNGVDETYGAFIQKVKNGRGLDSLFVDSIGQGRVWSGTRALEIGLVDEIGGLDRAVELAAELADLKDYGIVELPKQVSQLEQILKSFDDTSMKEKMLKEELGELYDTYFLMQKMRKQKGMMARMPYDIIIE